MREWPPIAEPELLRRLAFDDAEFAEFIGDIVTALPARECDEEAIALALAYPWARPLGSYLLRDGELEAFEAMAPEPRREILADFADAAGGRLPLIAIGSNGAPETLRRKFAHFSDAEDRTVLVLSGHLHGFDVGVAANPTMYGSMPATLFPSRGTAVRAAVLWVTPAQFTQLAWSEISYRLGKLRTRFDVEESAAHFDEVVVFVSRFGTFCPQGEPVALAAIPAERRSAPELSQRQLLGAAAALALGPGTSAEGLVRGVFEQPAETMGRVAATIHKAALPFASERWAPFG